MKTLIGGKSTTEWKEAFPLLEQMESFEPVLWINSHIATVEQRLPFLSLTKEDMEEAEKRWERFGPLLRKLFPETEKSGGIIESPLKEIPHMKEVMRKYEDIDLKGRFFLKCDNELPVAGSIKARGGIYEVLKHAEQLAIRHGLLKPEDDYSVLREERFKEFFHQYGIAVGSTGNLGLSIGIISASIGFRVTVHMSADAKEWKKQLLREKGVTVIEYASDYSKAVEEGRRQSEQDPMSYFVDDEQSKELFLGYSVAAYRLKKQLDQEGIVVDEVHPLVVYLPCGVGGAPGGITFGLKMVFGDYVHCFFAEPTHSPCMLLGLMTGLHGGARVQDFGIDNLTEADGLAVGAPSTLVCKEVGDWIEGVYTVEDEELYPMLALLKDSENIKIEPSAAASLLGPRRLAINEKSRTLISMENATHVAWATGGLFVPEELMKQFYERGKESLGNLDTNPFEACRS